MRHLLPLLFLAVSWAVSALPVTEVFNSFTDFRPAIQANGGGAFPLWDLGPVAKLPNGLIIFDQATPDGQPANQGTGVFASAIASYDSTQSGTARFAVFASRDTLQTLSSGETGDGNDVEIVVMNFAFDSVNNMYALIHDISDRRTPAPDVNAYYVVKWPSDGNGGLGTPFLLIPRGTIPVSSPNVNEDRYSIAVDTFNSRLVIGVDSRETADDATINGIYTAGLDGTNFQSFLSYVDLATSLTPPVANVGTDPMGLSKVVCDDQGYIYSGHDDGSGGNQGDLLRIDSSGDVVVLIEAAQFGTDPSGRTNFDFSGETQIAINPQAKTLGILGGGNPKDMHEWRRNGEYLRKVALETEILDAGSLFETDLNPDNFRSNLFALPTGGYLLLASDDDSTSLYLLSVPNIGPLSILGERDWQIFE